MLLLQPLLRKRYRSHGGTTKLAQTSTLPALPVKHSQQELSRASDEATVVTAIGSHTVGLAIQGHAAFTAHEKDTRKVTAG